MQRLGKAVLQYVRPASHPHFAVLAVKSLMQGLSVGHLSPQAVQLSFVPSRISHPLSGIPSQSALADVPDEHASTHLPPTHWNLPLRPWAVGHVTPHAPQLSGSFERLTSHAN